MFFIVFYGHSKAKIFSLDQFYANIYGITSKLENYCQKLIFHSIFWLVLGNEDKIMICPFFKFSALEHFCGLKLISWVDIWVVLIFVSGLIWKENLKNGQNVLEKWHNVVMRYYSHLFQMPPKKVKHGGARVDEGRKSLTGEYGNDKTMEEKKKADRNRKAKDRGQLKGEQRVKTAPDHLIT